MRRVQGGLVSGEVMAFEDERELNAIVEEIRKNGALRITGQRTVLGSQGLQMEGDYVVFAPHIVSVFV